MKKLIIAVFLFFSSPLLATEPIDLATMKSAGLSTESIGRFLAQNLDSTRAIQQLDANFMIKLGKYGGDELASAYLDLDKVSFNSSDQFFSPDKVLYYMEKNIEPKELKNLLLAEKEKVEKLNAHYAKRFTVSDIEESKQIEYAEPVVNKKTEALAQAHGAGQDLRSGQQLQGNVAGATPIAAARYEERPTQYLRPGQSADPASKLPPPESTYDIRRPRIDAPWMGVTERELPDGHIVEVNISGDSRKTGQEVISRPSGHKIYRYYSGSPDAPYSGADLEQQRRNLEELEIIFQRKG